jgi:dihydrofolate reductase
MRELIVQTFVTLDSVMQAPGGEGEDPSGDFNLEGWMPQYWNDEVAGAIGEWMSEPFEFVIGRRTYEIFAAHWPTSEDPGAPVMNSATKHVVSNTLQELEWENSRLVEGGVPNGVRALKEADGPELQVHGSSNLIQSLLEHGLIDEFRLLIFPLVLGKGKRLFDGGTVPAGLELADSQVFPNGVVKAVYGTGAGLELGTFAEDGA